MTTNAGNQHIQRLTEYHGILANIRKLIYSFREKAASPEEQLKETSRYVARITKTRNFLIYDTRAQGKTKDIQNVLEGLKRKLSLEECSDILARLTSGEPLPFSLTSPGPFEMELKALHTDSILIVPLLYQGKLPDNHHFIILSGKEGRSEFTDFDTVICRLWTMLIELALNRKGGRFNTTLGSDETGRKVAEDAAEILSSAVSGKGAGVEKKIEPFGHLKTGVKNVAVMYIDIRNSARLIEIFNHRPEIYSALISEFYDILSVNTFKNSGVVSKYMGDGAMTIFGARKAEKLSESELAMRCVHAATEIVRDFYRMTDHWRDTYLRKAGVLPTIDVGIGIDMGKCFLSTYSYKQDYIEYTALGNPAVFAQRLESMANKRLRIGQDMDFDTHYHKLSAFPGNDFKTSAILLSGPVYSAAAGELDVMFNIDHIRILNVKHNENLIAKSLGRSK